MARQIAVGTSVASPAVLESRIRELEAKTTTLAEAVRLLAHALENSPMAGVDDSLVDRAARKAHEMLMSSRH